MNIELSCLKLKIITKTKQNKANLVLTLCKIITISGSNMV